MLSKTKKGKLIYFLLSIAILAIPAVFIALKLSSTRDTGPEESKASDAPSVEVIDPQYIFVRKDNTCSNCYNWSGNDPDQINLDAINEIYNAVGSKGNSNRKLGISVLFFYNQVPEDKLKASLQRLLVYSELHDFPVFIVLDGFEWWDNRPDLWNWWDQNAAGYNPDNINNVEWTCWDSSCAIRKSWRNWGREFETKPQPNISSPTFISSNKKSLEELVPIIVTWYQALPNDKKYLLGGVSTSAEQDIGANYYYYPDGNPTGQGLNASVQQGYAALKTSGIKSSGSITPEDINAVIRQYQTKLNITVYKLGIPRNKIFNHNGGEGLAPFINYPSGVAFGTIDSSLNTYAQPGWSFYGDVTTNPQNFSDLTQTLDQVGNTQWASPEWLSWASDYNGWVEALRNSLNYRNNRFINIANWEGIRDKQYALDAIKTVLNETPTCWVTTPLVNVVTSGDNATLTWQKGDHNDAVYLNISKVGEFTFAGTLKTIDVANVDVTNKNSYKVDNLDYGNYYWTLAADGCSNQRKIANGSFQKAMTTATPTVVPTSAQTATPVHSPSPSPTPTLVKTPTKKATPIATLTQTPTPVHTPSPTPTVVETPTIEATPISTITPTPTNISEPTSVPTITPVSTKSPKPRGTSAPTNSADLDNSGRIDIKDFVLFSEYYSSKDTKADLDNNGSVGIDDFIIFRTEYTEQNS